MARKPLLAPSTKTVSALTALNNRTTPDTSRSAVQPGTGKVRKWTTEELLPAILHRHRPPNTLREGKYVHVSDLLYKCPRMIALARQQAAPVILPPLTESLGLTFAVGEAIHDYIRDKLKVAEARTLYGNWSCVCGTTSQFGTCIQAREASNCPRCERPLTEYNELRLRHEELQITGSVDLAFLIDQHLLLTEIKSINKAGWEGLTKPVPEHLLQIIFYWWLAKQAKLDIYDAVVVLYINKDFQFVGSPYKEFIVYPEKQIKRLANYIEDARMIKEAATGGPLPYRSCPNATAPDAKKCPLVVQCFHRESEPCLASTRV